MIKHLKITIYGWVQGIGFRWSSYEKFVDLGLTGKAENGEDGTVEITVQGEDFALQKLIEWCHKGPMGAKVTRVEVSEILNQHGNFESQNPQSQSDS
jgi:acylphosphatase